MSYFYQQDLTSMAANNISVWLMLQVFAAAASTLKLLPLLLQLLEALLPFYLPQLLAPFLLVNKELI